MNHAERVNVVQTKEHVPQEADALTTGEIVSSK